MGGKKWWIIGSVLALLVIVVLVVVLAQRRNDRSLIDLVEVTIEGPEVVALGSDVAYDVIITNGSSVPLSQASLTMIYPAGFSFTSAEPQAANQQGTDFALEDFSAGATSTTRINGRLTGAVDAEQFIIARLLFTPAGAAQPLQIEATFTTMVETSAFTFTVDGPPSGLPGEDVRFDIALVNNESVPLSNLEIHVRYPSGFTPVTLSPVPSQQDNTWLIESLGIGQRYELTIVGNLAGTIDEVKRFVFEAGVVGTDGGFNKQSEIEKVVKLTQPLVQITQTVDGGSEALVDAESTLDYTVTFQNTGPTGLSNLVLEVAFIGQVWNPATLSVRNGGALKDGVIRWDGVTVPELRLLEPAASGEVSFRVRPHGEIAVASSADKHFATTSTPVIRIGQARVEGNPITVKYRAQITPGGTATVLSGPNPPQVGQETVYTVTWTLSSLYNELTGARFVGEVPVGAEFVAGSGQVSVGEDLVFEQASKRVIWNIGNVPANVGKVQSGFSASFRVRVVPAVNEVGSEKILVTAQSFSANDVWTSEQRREPVPDLVTEPVQ